MQAVTYQVLFVSAALLLGCGKSPTPTFPVSGTIEFGDGTPVTFGMVEFVPKAPGASARGKIDSRGHFVLGTFTTSDGATPGKHQVIVVQHVTQGAVAPTGHSHESAASERSALVDVRFSQIKTSPLTATVQEGSNEVRLRVERSHRGLPGR